jgi:NRAMP (natural resistance-associated macrophage protein)-like metal ion transporter
VSSTRRARLGAFAKALGPGIVTGASDDDPSGIGTYAHAGAAYGYASLWVALITFPLSATVQYVCAKVALVSGYGLAGTVRERFPRAVLYPAVLALVAANTINAGVDIGAIAAGMNLIVPIPEAFFVLPVTGIILALLILGSYQLIARVFRWLTLALLAYIGSAILAHPDLGEVLRHSLVPTIQLESGFVLGLVALLGTTISPYLFFHQSEDEIEKEEEQGRRSRAQRKGSTQQELTFARWDVTLGIGFSNLVMYFILLGTASTLHQAGQTQVQSAADAAQALQPIAGDFAGLLFACGLIGAGFLAVPILTVSASYAMAEAFGWERGLGKKPHQAPRFYLVIAAATLLGMLINFLGINPIDALFWTAVLNGLLAPPLLVMIMLIANDRETMGARTNTRWTNVLGWGAAALMAASAVTWITLTLLG